MTDLIKREDALAACHIAPSDEWDDHTQSGYNFAAEECKRNIAALPAVEPVVIHQVDPAAIRDAAWMEALDAAHDYTLTQYGMGFLGHLADRERILAALTTTPVADSQPADAVVNDHIANVGKMVDRAACWQMKENLDRAIGWRDHDKTRAETAEAKLAEAVERSEQGWATAKAAVDRGMELGRKLAKAVEALRKMADGSSDNSEAAAKRVLAELEGK